jgi:two-component system CheB/CheR fusion protein
VQSEAFRDRVPVILPFHSPNVRPSFARPLPIKSLREIKEFQCESNCPTGIRTRLGVKIPAPQQRDRPARIIGIPIASILPMTRVLLVEDSADVLYVIQLGLEWMGYEVLTATDADSAIKIAVRTPPDIIVSDLGLPGIDGFEFLRLIRQTSTLAAVPAIALTGAATDDDIQRALAAGFTAHMSKPVEAADLGKRIEQLTARRRKRKAG